MPHRTSQHHCQAHRRMIVQVKLRTRALARCREVVIAMTFPMSGTMEDTTKKFLSQLEFYRPSGVKTFPAQDPSGQMRHAVAPEGDEVPEVDSS